MVHVPWSNRDPQATKGIYAKDEFRECEEALQAHGWQTDRDVVSLKAH
jgi:hypothetical protein